MKILVSDVSATTESLTSRFDPHRTPAGNLQNFANGSHQLVKCKSELDMRPLLLLC